jgi:hypothetical protein
MRWAGPCIGQAVAGVLHARGGAESGHGIDVCHGKKAKQPELASWVEVAPASPILA